MSKQEQPHLFDQIQTICRDYRKHLKRGEVKPMERFLDRVDEQSRGILFQNLLHIDIEFRRRNGENPSSEEYCSRFPSHAKLVRQAFFESTMMSRDSAEAKQRELEPPETVGTPLARRLGNYELVRELGRGGFGVVYESRHVDRGDRLALKTLPMMSNNASLSAGDAERLHRFRREFRSLAEINHPNLAGMQTLETDGNQWFFTMDLIEGDDFLGYVRPNGSLEESRLRTTIKQLVCGIIALHDQGIVHRDLKPSNVLVGSDGRVTILDFGLVAQLQHFANDTFSIGTKNFAGTPRYAAPEQVAGQRSAAVDWYSLGVMIFEAITGSAPFRESGVDLLIAKQTLDAPMLSGREGVPNDLAELVDALLQRDPQDRPKDAELGEKLGVDTESAMHGSSSADNDSSEGSLSGGEFFLVGRESQLADLSQNLTEFAADRSPRAVFISGRSGEGKSTLAETFLYQARRDQGILVFSGRCYDRESVPFKAIDCLIDPLVGFLRARDTHDLDQILPSDIGMLAYLFPVLRRIDAISDRCSTVVSHIDSRQLRFRAFAALRELFANIGQSRPIILFVDDLQWGDADSAAALHEVLRPPDSPAVFLLGSYRSDEAESSQLLTEWKEKQSDPATSIEQRHVKVAPLSEEDCVLLIARRLGIAPESLRQQSGEFFADTQGNPYFVEQLIEGFDPASNQFLSVPLGELIERKLDRLPSPAKSILEAICVAGQPAAVDEITEVSKQQGDAFTTLTHMRSERLVRLIDSHGRQFVDSYHDKIRETVLANLADQDRRTLHVRFGETIENLAGVNSESAIATLDCDCTNDDKQAAITDRACDLGYHFFAAGESRGFVYQLLAGEQLYRAYASDESVEFLKRSLRTLPVDASDQLRYRLFERLATSLMRLNESDDALDYFYLALENASSRIQRALVMHRIGEIHTRASQFDEATSWFERELDEVGCARTKSLPRVIFRLLASMFWIFNPWLVRQSRDKSRRIYFELASNVNDRIAWIELTRGRTLYFVEAATRGVVNAYQSGRPETIARSLTWLTWTSTACALFFLARHFINRALRFAQQSETVVETAVIDVYWSGCLYTMGEPDRAEEIVKPAFAELERLGEDSIARSMACHILRHAHFVQGESRQELEAGHLELLHGQSVGDRELVCWAKYGIANAEARMGKISDAYRSMSQCMAGYEGRGHLVSKSVALHHLGFLQIQASDYLNAIDTLEGVLKRIRKDLFYAEFVIRSYPWLIEALLGPDWIDPANGPRVRRANKVAFPCRFFAWGYPTIRAHSQRMFGRLAARRGDTRKAARMFEKSITLAKQYNGRYDLARGLLDLAAVQEKGRDENRAKAVLMLKRLESTIPHAEAWQLGDQFDPEVVAPAPDDVATQ